MKLCVVGEGAFGNKHLDALASIESVEVASLVGGSEAETRSVAEARGIPHWTLDLQAGISQEGIEGVILATPTPLHAMQAIQVLQAGKHVLVEIPMADNLADAEALVRTQKQTGLVAMVGHVRRFNPSHQFLHNKIKTGDLKLQQLDVQTYFFRRSNINALGKPRDWTDHLLWHHACHTVDLFQYQTGEKISKSFALQGPIDAKMGIATDMSIGLQVPSGALCTLSLSFNNDGPLGSYFRYICDNGTYIARYDDLFHGNEQQIDVSGVDVSMSGIELIDREFISAIGDNREPNASVAQCLSTMHALHLLDQSLAL